MEELTLDLPALFGDHHVTEVRRILLEMPGVADVYASSCFRIVRVTYDPGQTGADAITARLDQAGYLGELAAPREPAARAVSSDAAAASGVVYSRRAVTYNETGRTIGFAQDVGCVERTLIPCPGMGTLQGERRSKSGVEPVKEGSHG